MLSGQVEGRQRNGAIVGTERAKTMLAASAFHDCARLGCAVAALMKLGLDPSGLAILTTPEALDGRLHHTVGDQLAPAIQFAGTGRPSGLKGEWYGFRQTAMAFAEWVPQRCSGEFQSHLEGGGCVLFVAIPNDVQGRMIVDILLSHSEEAVQFHEFAWPRH